MFPFLKGSKMHDLIFDGAYENYRDNLGRKLTETPRRTYVHLLQRAIKDYKQEPSYRAFFKVAQAWNRCLRLAVDIEHLDYKDAYCAYNLDFWNTIPVFPSKLVEDEDGVEDYYEDILSGILVEYESVLSTIAADNHIGPQNYRVRAYDGFEPEGGARSPESFTMDGKSVQVLLWNGIGEVQLSGFDDLSVDEAKHLLRETYAEREAEEAIYAQDIFDGAKNVEEAMFMSWEAHLSQFIPAEYRRGTFEENLYALRGDSRKKHFEQNGIYSSLVEIYSDAKVAYDALSYVEEAKDKFGGDVSRALHDNLLRSTLEYGAPDDVEKVAYGFDITGEVTAADEIYGGVAKDFLRVIDFLDKNFFVIDESVGTRAKAFFEVISCDSYKIVDSKDHGKDEETIGERLDRHKTWYLADAKAYEDFMVKRDPAQGFETANDVVVEMFRQIQQERRDFAYDLYGY